MQHMPIATESRCRIGIEWYTDESDAEERAAYILANVDCTDANIGYVQCGRATSFDRTVDNQRWFAVVTP
jgi:hypothetical protein